MIELFHVTKRYEGTERPALDDINIKIAKGEFCLLTGASGAGKTTLLRLLFCAEQATRGQVMLHGKHVARLNARQISLLRRNIGVVFQDFKLLLGRTVFDNVALTLEVQGLGSRDIKTRVDAVLEQVGLWHKTRQTAAQLSGGEQQRVAIARALVAEPAILLCDEPTGNLDPERAHDIMQLLLAAHMRGTTIVVATHDPHMIERYGKRLIHLHDGKIAQGIAHA